MFDHLTKHPHLLEGGDDRLGRAVVCGNLLLALQELAFALFEVRRQRVQNLGDLDQNFIGGYLSWTLSCETWPPVVPFVASLSL